MSVVFDSARWRTGFRSRRGRGHRLRLPLLLALLSLAALALPAAGQRLERDVPLEIPDFEPDPGEASSPPLLPPIPDEIQQELDRPGDEGAIESIRFIGNAALEDEELSQATSSFIGRGARRAVLERLQTRVTNYYISLGYVNSGARLPTVDDGGIVTVEITEGEIGALRFDGLGRLPEFFVENDLVRPGDGPLNLFALEDRVRLLRQDPRIQDLSLHVQASAEPGLADLQIQVEPATPYYVALEAANQQSPSVGAEYGQLVVGHYNLAGLSDHLELRGSLSDGLRELIAEYDLPASPWRTRLVMGARVLRAEVVENPFDELNLESEQDSAWIRLRQPLYDSLRVSHELSVEFEWKRSLTTAFGQPLDVVFGPIEDPNVLPGSSEAFLLRAIQRSTYRGRRFALALSNTLTRSFDVPGTTSRSPRAPGSEFLAWLGQLSGAARIAPLDSQLFARFQVQLASSRVLGFEQFSVGGLYTVRGYRENQLVRDNGLAGSVEWRVPVLPGASDAVRVWLFPFFDFGRSWNRQRGSEPYEWIYSAGLGTRVEVGRHLDIDFSWAEGLRGSEDGLSGDLQDSGFQFRVSLKWPGR